MVRMPILANKRELPLRASAGPTNISPRLSFISNFIVPLFRQGDPVFLRWGGIAGPTFLIVVFEIAIVIVCCARFAPRPKRAARPAYAPCFLLFFVPVCIENNEVYVDCIAKFRHRQQLEIAGFSSDGLSLTLAHKLNNNSIICQNDVVYAYISNHVNIENTPI